MPSQRVKVSDFVSRLGLRAPFTKKSTDWNTCPAVKEMYEVDLSELCKTHHVKPMELIPQCPEIRAAAMKLLKTYGSQVWSSDMERPWLFTPGEHPGGVLYEKDLYYVDIEDRHFLRKTFYSLVVAKVLRWRKDNIRTSSTSTSIHVNGDTQRDSSYSPTPWASSRQTSSFQCFSGPGDHTEASALQTEGIWLGDFDEEKAEIGDCMSWDDVGEMYFDSTIGATECNGAEPFAFDENPGVKEKDVECAACRHLLKIQCVQLEHKEESTQTTMSKNIWVFACKLADRTVFACIKELPERDWRRMGSTTPLWSFWNRNGGYTKNCLLRSLPQNPDAIDKGKKRLGEEFQENVDRVPAKRPTRPSFLPINRPHGAQVQGQGSTTGRQDSPNSLYDTTPRPEPQPRSASLVLRPIDRNEHTATGVFAQREDHTRPPLGSSRADLPPPTLSLRFKVWFTVPWSTGRNVVILDDSMGVQDVYTKVQQGLRRQLADRTLLALGIKLSQEPDEEANNVEIDDRDGWETLLELVRDGEKKEAFGVIYTE